MDRQEILADDVQARFRQEMVDIGDAARDGVLDGNHAEIGDAIGNRREGVLEAGAGQGFPFGIHIAAGDMRIRAGFEIAYDCPAFVPMLLTLSVHPSRQNDLETADWVRTDPFVDVRKYIDAFGNVCSQVVAPPGRPGCRFRNWCANP